jgi:hypothetical protein
MVTADNCGLIASCKAGQEMGQEKETQTEKEEALIKLPHLRSGLID